MSILGGEIEEPRKRLVFDAQKLREVRRQRGMTQEEVADILGVKRQFVTFWEGGQYAPNGVNTALLMRALVCKIEDITSAE